MYVGAGSIGGGAGAVGVLAYTGTNDPTWSIIIAAFALTLGISLLVRARLLRRRRV